MASADPFERVLKTLGLCQQIQAAMGPINSRHIPAWPTPKNDTLEVPCGIRPVKQDAPIDFTDREQQALRLIALFHPTSERATQIRPMSFILEDGIVQLEDVKMLPDRPRPGVYPLRYRIPHSTISNLPLEEQVWRSEKFALGTLLYEVLTGQNIFEGESDELVQDHYISGTFPDLTATEYLSESLWPSVIYSCWSAKFGRYIALGKFGRYVHDNPGRFALHVAGGVISTAAIFTVPILGAVGFSSLGPVAGLAATIWQASIGLVEAGSFFAVCQSAAMGGAAATGVAVTGAAGGAVTIAASGLPNLRSLRETFVRKFREEAR